MKKNIMLSLVAAMSFMVITPVSVHAEESKAQARCGNGEMKKENKAKSSKNSEQRKKQSGKNKQRAETGKDCMHKIQKELHRIKADFKENGDFEAADAKLRTMPAKIKKAVAKIKGSEEHGAMWETHEHTMNRELKDVIAFVNGEKNS